MARILIVDDDVQVREMLRQKLERSGYEVIKAPNGNVAIELHHAQPADLIIMDIIMPKKEGIETFIITPNKSFLLTAKAVFRTERFDARNKLFLSLNDRCNAILQQVKLAVFSTIQNFP